MKLDEITISKGIIDIYFRDLRDSLESDVIIVGGGPAGLTASYYLAKAGKKTVLLERALKIGGGMPGGGIMFNKIVVQESSKFILDEFDIDYEEYEKGYYIASSIESTSQLTSKAVKAGAKIFNLISVEDVMIRGEEITGAVINWTAVQMANLHIDPITMRSRYLIDATGHDTEIVKIVERKIEDRLFTPTGKIMGEKSMWAENAENIIEEHTKEVYNNLYVCGMAANATFGAPRMGPIFGGMLLSGKKVAKLIIERDKR
jgi:thiamine thiazole synthase